MISIILKYLLKDLEQAGVLIYFCSIKACKFFKALIILWGDEMAKARQTCPLVSGVEITG